MLSIAVCDDEILECCHISGQVRRILEGMGISHALYQYTSGRELLEARERFDIVLLDILMEELDGMRTAELFRRKSPEPLLVFITSSREYVFDAWEVEAFHYLVKPISEERLKRVLEKAVKKLEAHEKDFIVVSQNRRQIKLFLEDIFCFEVMGRVICAHGKNGITEFYEKISTLEERLSGKGFFRCHKSYLVNLGHVEGYDRQEALLDNGEKILISKRRYREFCQEILSHMRKNGGLL